MKPILYGLAIIALVSCSNSSENQTEDESNKEHVQADSSNADEFDATKLNSEPTNLWLSENYEPYLDFPESEESVWIVFLGQCMYKYPIEKNNDLIEVKYDTTMDCLVDIGFRKDFGVKSPKIGETFIELKTEEDTIFANYLFPAWTDSLNAQNQSQPLFVEKFVRTD
jgi:hypothetical protein